MRMIDRVLLEELEPRVLLSGDLGTVSTSLLTLNETPVVVSYDLPELAVAPADGLVGRAVSTVPVNPGTSPGALSVYNGMVQSESNPGFCDPALDFDYLVVTNEFLRDASSMDYTMADFVARKEANGYATTVITVEDIYANYTGVDTQEAIRNFITDAYNSWGIEYVLLAGNAEVVPVRQVVNDAAGSPYIVTDMYYQCLDGSWDGNGNGVWGERTDGEGGGEIDWYSEVYIGRALVGTEEQLANWVYKTLDYEDKADAAYRHNALMVGEYTGFGGTYANWGKYCMDKLITGSTKGGFTTAGFNADPTFDVDTMYAKDQSWGASDIINAINMDQYGIYNHLGHGNGGTVMIANDVQYDASLTNENPFFLYSQACWPGYYLTPGSVAEALTTHTRHGAAATVLNSNYGWGVWEDGTDGSSQRVNREFWDAAFSEGIYTLGAMNADSHEDLVWNIGNSQVRSVILDTTLFGDPSLKVFDDSMAFLTDANLQTAYEGEAYTGQIEIIYGQGPYVFNVIDGALPTGVTMDTNGVFTGTPGATGEYDFTVQVTDTGSGDILTRLFNLTVDDGMSFGMGATLPDAYEHVAYSVDLAVTGGTGVYTFEIVSGALPAGVELDTSTGIISGMPTELGAFSVTISATDSEDFPQTITKAFGVTVAELQPGFYGQVFNDTNANGVRDAGELGQDGVTMLVVDAVTGAVLDTTVTASVDVDGNGTIDLETERGLYSLPVAEAGRYILRQEAPSGWDVTTMYQGAQRIFATRTDAGVSSIVELDPSDMSMLATFPAPTNVAVPILGGLAVGPESLFYIDGSSMGAAVTLYELDIETGATIATHTLNNPAPSGFMGMAWLNDNVYMFDVMNGMTVFDTATGAVTGTYTLTGSFSGGLTGAPDRGTLFLSGNGGQIYEIDPSTWAILHTLTPGLGVLSGGLAYVDGILFAAPNNLDAAGSIHRINASTGALLVARPTTGGGVLNGLAGDALPAPTLGEYRVDLDGTTALRDLDFGVILAQPADFDQDGDVDADDIDQLTANFGDVMYDLNGDGNADAGDVDYMLDTILFTVRGDMNLDGRVDLVDLARIGDFYGSTSAGWAAGDTDGNGIVDLVDLATFGDNYGYDNSGALVIMPMVAMPTVQTAEDVVEIHVSGSTPVMSDPRVTLVAMPAGESLMGPVAVTAAETVDNASSDDLLPSVFSARISGSSVDAAARPWRSAVEGESVLDASFVMPTGFLTTHDDDEERSDVLMDMGLL